MFKFQKGVGFSSSFLFFKKQNTKMKSLIVLLLAFNINCFSQVTKFKTTSTGYSILDERTQRWGTWDMGESGSGQDILIYVDLTSERIKIFAKAEQVYDILKYYDKYIDNDGDTVLSWLCIDKDGKKCKIRVLVLKSQNNRKQLYVGYSDIVYLYNIYNLD